MSDNEEAAPSEKRFRGQCLCGAVLISVAYPAFWAWHDHSLASRRAHGAVYATYIGCWRKNVHIVKGEDSIARYEDKRAGTKRSFCKHCGSPLIYERKSSRHMINLPRALFTGRTGREPRYHLNIAEIQDWAYSGAPLVPLKGYPGVVWERPKAKKRSKASPSALDDAFTEAFRSAAARPSRKPKPR